ncbi:hypothetical protein TRAPUB_13569 [Trametes pubescens]|uniref:Uncharacterized protein n=1 Tax=Trametes pubescens TaxID=154538 RepID=A0A1M2VR11_TRAPU|nr:hypothetical protein TRAPUB_13569 [Trametes pubescens]
MFIPMQTHYEQDYYPPHMSSRSPSPRESSASPPPRSERLPPAHYPGRARRSSHAYPYRAPPAPPTSIPLDENFDAATTAAPSEWGQRRGGGGGDGGGDGDGHPEYDESVTGYQNYVVELERMLEGQIDTAAQAQARMLEAYRERDLQRQREQDSQQQQRSPPPPPSNGRPRPRALSTASVSGIPKTHGGDSRRRVDCWIDESACGRGSTRPEWQVPDTMSPPPPPVSAPRPMRRHQKSLPLSLPVAPSPPLPPPPPDYTRHVSGKKGRVELVEQRVLEDSAVRTISLWRERVAASSVGGSASRYEETQRGGEGDEREGERREAATGGGMGDGRSVAGSHAHRRVPSGSMNGDPRLRRVMSEHARYESSDKVRHGKGADGGKRERHTYERSEYMVSYDHANGGMPVEMLPGGPQGAGGNSTRELRTPSSPTTDRRFDRGPPSPSLRRHAARKSMDRSERPQYMISYPNTPPHTDSQASSGSIKHPRGAFSPAPPAPAAAGPLSPLHGSFQNMRDALPLSPTHTGALKATTTSSVEAILAACDPSLLHIAPVLHELGIRRVDHLRAIPRLSEETRDREVKEQALRRGVSVVEWAIFLDKLQTL